ncbi:Hint domain-containing protein [Mycolicibacterium mucogenicum]|uniref:Hint domain-containing protein n=1 Tax=Mycolicibacterium mucogenicum TaxID=56689 RepID=UPI002269AD88|nr:Hint domain-containing protein [Mycolicibacterium mucogenicum]MCX8561181.1 Hint domain-containing protein [Mycolicibacterium mucogenicum]
MNFVPGERSWWSRTRWWRVPVALVVTIILSICGIFWLAGVDRPRTEQHAGLSLAQPFADTAAVSPAAVNAPELPAAPLAQRVPCAGQSFSPETLVLLADGTKRPIAELKVGDRVWSVDPETGRTSGQLVQAVLIDHDTELLDVTITNPADVASVVHTTAKHPFYSTARAHTASSEVSELAATTGTASRPGAEWVDARDLRPGDQLATPFRDSVAHVAGSTPVFGSADMWDLTIANTHAFYVATLTAAVLVHNCPMR